MAVLKNKIELKNVSKVYETRDKQVEVLNNLSFEVHENEFLVLLGPGRCGKTVLLNILANLEKQTSGTIEFAGGRPKMGDLGMVFQKYALFPWKTVMGNVEMSQKLKGVDKKVRQEKAQEYIEVLDRKSQRLKKLTEDLVEASKASTGNLEVNLAPCQPGVLLTQAAGEYEQKLKDAGLDLSLIHI